MNQLAEHHHIGFESSVGLLLVNAYCSTVEKPPHTFSLSASTRHLCSHIRFRGSSSTSPRCWRLHDSSLSSCPHLLFFGLSTKVCIFCLPNQSIVLFVLWAEHVSVDLSRPLTFSRISTGQLRICLCFVTSLLESLSNYLKQVTQGSTAQKQISILLFFLLRAARELHPF